MMDALVGRHRVVQELMEDSKVREMCQLCWGLKGGQEQRRKQHVPQLEGSEASAKRHREGLQVPGNDANVIGGSKEPTTQRLGMTE